MNPYLKALNVIEFGQTYVNKLLGGEIDMFFKADFSQPEWRILCAIRTVDAVLLENDAGFNVLTQEMGVTVFSFLLVDPSLEIDENLIHVMQDVYHKEIGITYDYGAENEITCYQFRSEGSREQAEETGFYDLGRKLGLAKDSKQLVERMLECCGFISYLHTSPTLKSAVPVDGHAALMLLGATFFASSPKMENKMRYEYQGELVF